jgi:hypothetical protein
VKVRIPSSIRPGGRRAVRHRSRPHRHSPGGCPGRLAWLGERGGRAGSHGQRTPGAHCPTTELPVSGSGQVGPAGPRGEESLERSFHTAMVDVYQRAKREAGITPPTSSRWCLTGAGSRRPGTFCMLLAFPRVSPRYGKPPARPHRGSGRAAGGLRTVVQ